MASNTESFAADEAAEANGEAKQPGKTESAEKPLNSTEELATKTEKLAVKEDPSAAKN